ncbi:ER-derived vesicles protein ERV14 [Corchorus olitorius]|uniref:ER-derived vesicles protein ERV14 n=1 Tax=Corchorus olitorius TaxID=93759 RepID=A0A1R3K0H9_9ROSI|nr:ER-derived vesicles protein ERV14 [Corchorus olitorius]
MANLFGWLMTFFLLVSLLAMVGYQLGPAASSRKKGLRAEAREIEFGFHEKLGLGVGFDGLKMNFEDKDG